MRTTGLVSALLLASLARAAANPTLDAIPDNTWVKVEHAGLDAPNGILAYSGMAYDTARRTLLVFGGGHCDYDGNEVWELDIESLTWTQLSAPDPDPATLTASSFSTQYPGAVFDPVGEPLGSARPLSRHTYDTVEYIGVTGELFVTGVYTYGSATGFGCGGQTVTYCWGCDDTWTYDPVNDRWTYRNVARSPLPSGLAGAAYDPISGLMYVADRNAIWTYDVQQDLWEQLQPGGPAPPTSIEMIVEYDAKRRWIYRFAGDYPSHDELWRYDIASNTWQNLEPGGPAPPAQGGWGLAYDRVNDVLVAYRGGAGTWIYDPSTNAWSNATSTDPGSPDRIHGNLKYDPVHNVTLLVKPGIETWAYRYRAGTPDTTRPRAPANVQLH